MLFIGTVELTSNAHHIHCGQDVTFSCRASGTNFVAISVNELGPYIFLRNSKSTAQLGYVDMILMQADIDPMNPLLTIFVVEGRIESAKSSLLITCSDITSSQSWPLALQSKHE